MSTAVASGVPWAPASEIASTIGFNSVIFGYPGVGKTTFAASAQDHSKGKGTFFWAIDSGIRSLADRSDVMVWPKPGNRPTWDDLLRVSDGLRREGKNPFQTLVLDDLTKAYDLALKKALGGTNREPDWGDWRKANDAVTSFMEEWSERSRTDGINFIVNAHAKDVVEGEGEGAIIHVRIVGTPGLVQAIPRVVDSMGYLELKPRSSTRKQEVRTLILHQTTRVKEAKYRQPRSGPQLPDEIVDPTMSKILDHIDQINSHRQRIQAEGLIGKA
jgi:AAA domain